ncbi:MAG TPA: hypothetical protein VJS63_01350 [Bradyrhizobium sp.]|nr:hypothetical protein [Bradyrhizobium sp.]
MTSVLNLIEETQALLATKVYTANLDVVATQMRWFYVILRLSDFATQRNPDSVASGLRAAMRCT